MEPEGVLKTLGEGLRPHARFLLMLAGMVLAGAVRRLSAPEPARLICRSANAGAGITSAFVWSHDHVHGGAPDI